MTIHYAYFADAQFIVLAPKDQNTYYFDRTAYDKAIENLKVSNEWSIINYCKEVIIFERNK